MPIWLAHWLTAVVHAQSTCCCLQLLLCAPVVAVCSCCVHEPVPGHVAIICLTRLHYRHLDALQVTARCACNKQAHAALMCAAVLWGRCHCTGVTPEVPERGVLRQGDLGHAMWIQNAQQHGHLFSNIERLQCPCCWSALL
jgi:hypothetical protein